MAASYEWTLETIEDGDIIDSDFSDTLTFMEYNPLEHDLAVVRNEGNEREGVTDRFWAYVKFGKLPEYFSDASGNPVGIKVPKKFHVELENKFGQKQN